MRFIPSDPDISTIFNRIQNKDIDLQPAFQRGEVWSTSKQQRLIDSILRGWIIPPILIITTNNDEQQVLDGQQRLASIRDFLLDLFSVDGEIEPYDKNIIELDQKKYSDLPIEIKKRFDRTPIRIFEVTDFQPNEPAEIFFRLNQPTPLTAAERRNAFFGPVRDQIRQISSELEKNIQRSSLSFSNSRMAYDEIIGRIVCTLESGTLQKKITASTVDEIYRREEPISPKVINLIHHVTLKLCHAINDISATQQPRIRLSRATLHSWLIFLIRNTQITSEQVSKFLPLFEKSRTEFDGKYSNKPEGSYINGEYFDLLAGSYSIFNDRASSRANDASSVIARDIVIWIHWIFGFNHPSNFTEHGLGNRLVNLIESTNQRNIFNELGIDTIIENTNWGARL